ncbi:phenylacetate--CoA ligase family protein [Pseudofrankia saprophytica]|uniref:phenylacetate--CoA ligase family protein n=1 Tax=Pseudofrankia saprophytica TaxID=298655 RepID=UPI000234B3AE|nr:phenylacetate--CoA ligase family protein [Pseudofrankia saprophytica]
MTYLEPEIETAPADRIASEQTRRLLEVVRLAHERSALYQGRWDPAGVKPDDVQSPADFRRLVPFIDKDAVRAFRDRTGDAFGGLLCVDPADLTTITASSGTTGDPTFFNEMWAGLACAPLPAGYLRALWMMGVRPGDRVLCNAATFRGWIEDAFRAMGLVPLLVDTWMGKWAEVLRVIEQHRPTYVQLMSTNLVELEHLAPHHDLRKLFDSFKAVSFAGEPLGARMRERLSTEWGLDVFVYTSAGDTGLAWECTEHDGYHLWWDEVFLEVVDPATGEPVAEGEVGEMVVTSLDNDAAPLIRYRTGDLVRHSTAVCPCGRTSPRVWVLGRGGDETVVAGRSVLPHEIWTAVESVDETQTGLFQIIRPTREVERLRLRVGYDASRPVDLPELAARLASSVADAARLPAELVDIELETEEALLRRGSAAKVPRVAKS